MPVDRDPYLYPDTNVLKNKYDILIKEDLENLEGDFTALRLRELALAPINGNFDYTHVCAIHEYIFQDVYEWAGRERIVNIEKPEAILSFDSVIYADAKSIKHTFESVSKQMRSYDWKKSTVKGIVTNFSKYYSYFAHKNALYDIENTITYLINILFRYSN
jgi:fido (protein-threonine AMPylation protein)